MAAWPHVSIRARVALITFLFLLVPSFAVACGLAPRESLPATNDATIRSVVSAGLHDYYEQSMLPTGVVAGQLSDDDHKALRERVISTLENHYTGSALQDRLTATLSWADEVATYPVLRTTIADFRGFDGDVVLGGGGDATVAGTFEVDLVNARGIGTSLEQWGGLLKMSFTATLTESGGQWRIASLVLGQLAYEPDPAVWIRKSAVPETVEPTH